MLALRRWKLNSKFPGQLLMPPLLPRSMLQQEQVMAERLNQMSAAAGGTYYTFFHFVGFPTLLCLLMYSFSIVLLFS
jgi:hypothetical protein